MFFIPGFLVALVTFPGVIVHEAAHQLFCRFFNVAVLDVCYFRLGNPSGYVIHEPTRKSSHNILIGIGPFFVNTILGALIATPAMIPVGRFGSGDVLDYFLAWVGVSIAMHAFPSTGDAKSIWAAVNSEGTPILTKMAAIPVVGIIYAGAVGSMFWLDLIYGVLIAFALPTLLINLLA
jgi:hypothetical protein